jgi:uncharacterized integral membrane protein
MGVVMHRLKRWILVFFVLIVFVLSVSFSLWNTTPVALSLGVYEFGLRPLAFWLIAAFCLGGFSGMVVGSGLVDHVRLRLRVRSLEKELESRPKFIRRES